MVNADRACCSRRESLFLIALILVSLRRASHVHTSHVHTSASHRSISPGSSCTIAAMTVDSAAAPDVRSARLELGLGTEDGPGYQLDTRLATPVGLHDRDWVTVMACLSTDSEPGRVC